MEKRTCLASCIVSIKVCPAPASFSALQPKCLHCSLYVCTAAYISAQPCVLRHLRERPEVEAPSDIGDKRMQHSFPAVLCQLQNTPEGGSVCDRVRPPDRQRNVKIRLDVNTLSDTTRPDVAMQACARMQSCSHALIQSWPRTPSQDRSPITITSPPHRLRTPTAHLAEALTRTCEILDRSSANCCRVGRTPPRGLTAPSTATGQNAAGDVLDGSSWPSSKTRVCQDRALHSKR